MANKKKIHEIVTKEILTLLDEGTAPWLKPWTANDAPRNYATGRRYSGINLWFLQAMQVVKFTSPYWATKKQVEERGGTVREGERYTPVLWFKQLEIEVEGDQPDTTKTKKIPIERFYQVYNFDQCDGLKPREEDEDARTFDPLEDAQKIADGYFKREDAPVLKHGASGACYVPDKDIISMPRTSTFHSVEEYYSTLFHEAAHSTKKDTRTNRIAKKLDYATEELVAELGSSFLCAESGISRDELIKNQAAYCAYWAKVVKADPTTFIKAGREASKAATFITGETA